MKDARQVLLGVLAALLSLSLVLGSVSMAITEGNILAFVPTLTLTPTATLIPTLLESTPIFTATRAVLTPGITLPPSLTPTLTFTLSPLGPTATLAASCGVPPGWTLVTVQMGDTLASLAAAYNTTPELLAQNNCLVTNTLIPGTTIYVPGQPTVTPAVPCGPPPGWVYYVILPGDTLSSIGQMFGVSVADLQMANCMGNQTLIRAGQRIFVPNRPTKTPTQTITLTLRPPNTPTPTTPVTITPTPTPVIILPTYTNTTVPTWTSTSVPPTATSTNTPVPVPTDTLTPTPLPIVPPTPTITPSSIISGTIGLASNP